MAFLRSLREALWLMIGIVVAALLFEMVFERIPRGAPMTYHSVEAVQPRVPRGGTLLVRIHATKHRSDCEIAINRFLVSEDGEVRLLPATTEVPLIEPGDRWLVVGVPLPKRIEPGRYAYFSATEYVCPDKRYVVRTEPAPFEIVADDEDGAGAGD